MVAAAVILVLVDMCSRFGVDTLRRWIQRKEPGLKVKLMHEAATVPTRGTEGSAGLDLTTVEEYKIPAGEYMLIRTGIAVELPYGTYGRIASRSSLASRGLQIGGGVIDRDYRGEIKVLMYNHSAMEFWVRPGDRVAQLIVEKVMEVQVQQVDSLSSTARGLGGFGSTNAGEAALGVTSFSVRKLGQFDARVLAELYVSDTSHIFAKGDLSTELYFSTELYEIIQCHPKKPRWKVWIGRKFEEPKMLKADSTNGHWKIGSVW
eukprot:s4469_g2.t1